MAFQRVHRTIKDSYNPNDVLKPRVTRAVLARNRVDLREELVIPVYDQENIGSCSANAICSAYLFSWNHLDEPSRLFLYYNSRAIEGAVNEDTGVRSIRDAIMALNDRGVCREGLWQYLESNLFRQPDRSCYLSACRHRAGKDSVKGRVRCERLLDHHSRRQVSHPDDIHQLKVCLHRGSPFVFAFNVYDNFHHWDGKTHNSVMPHRYGPCGGGHAVMAVGYDNSIGKEGCIIVLNSWGPNWGDNGFFYMPYDIIVNPCYCFDFWEISFVQ